MSDPLPTLVARNSITYYAGIFFKGVGIGVMGALWIADLKGAASLPGWTMIFNSGLLLWISVAPLLDTWPRIIIDRSGIFDRNLSVSAQIRGAT